MNKVIIVLIFLTGMPFHAVLKAQHTKAFDIIMERIHTDNAVRRAKQADAPSIKLFENWQDDGSWADVKYGATDITKWQPTVHLERLRTIVNAYTDKGGSFYGNPQIFAKIQQALIFWFEQDPKSKNWWHNDISVPQKLGELLISLRYGAEQLPKQLENQLLERMKRGSAEEKTGANKTDIATHYLYRALLTSDPALLQLAVDQLFEPIALVDRAEGLQHDYSYLQHGPQLYISGYGGVYLTSIINVAKYVADTDYALNEEKLNLFSKFYREVYLKTLRSKYIDFNVEGRGISRKNILRKNEVYRIGTAKLIDPKNEKEWDDLGLRVDSSRAPSYGVTPYHQHFWKGDYTLHVRPNYSFNVRISSERTNRSESGNDENLLGRYLSDGATNIQVNGPEYFNIMPLWEWDKIPGTTSVNNENDLPLDKFWGHPGDNTYAGGVSDQRYGVTAYQLTYDGVSAKKAWFFFDDEIVCLGADIQSTSDKNVTTTLNQAWLQGDVSTSGPKVLANDVEPLHFTRNGWLFHDGIGYLFPEETDAYVSTQVQTGSWFAINNSFGNEEQSGSVFKSWIDHGVQPKGAEYAYIVVPGVKNASAIKRYTNPIEIAQNNKNAQAIFHQKLDIVQAAFYEAGSVHVNGIIITVDKPVILMLNALKGREKELFVADPLQKEAKINLTLEDTTSGKKQHLLFDMPQGAYAGSSVSQKMTF